MARKKASGKQGSRSAKGKPARKRAKRPASELVNYRHMHALSKKERVQIFAILCERVASPKEISEEVGERLSNVSYHVKVLRECHLIAEDHQVRRRGAIEHFYRATTPTLIPPDTWDHLPAAVRSAVTFHILQHFFEDVSTSMTAGVFDQPPGELSWTPLILDSLGIEEFGQLARDFLKSVLELQANASKRLPKGEGKATDTTSATAFLATFLSARSPLEGKKAPAAKRR